MQQSRLTTVFALLALLGWGAFYYKIKYPSTVYKDRMVEVQKVVQKVVQRDVVVNSVKTITKPNGTTVVVQTKAVSSAKEQTKEQTRVVEQTTQLPLPKYSLGLSVGVQDFLPKPIYKAEIGYRLVDPLWITLQAGSNKELTIGLRLEF